MSYSVTVAIKDGEPVVAMGGDVPDGDFVISGHEDKAQRSLTVQRRAPDGRYVEAASHTHYKEG